MGDAVPVSRLTSGALVPTVVPPDHQCAIEFAGVLREQAQPSMRRSIDESVPAVRRGREAHAPMRTGSRRITPLRLDPVRHTHKAGPER